MEDRKTWRAVELKDNNVYKFNGKGVNTKVSDLMTGKEFYDKFIEEMERLIELGIVSKHSDQTDAMLAARKAAGLE